nr:retropepsin-like aspartic protease [Aquimarina sp. MMG016]
MHLLGIIGYDILKDYEVFIDLHLNQITLSKVDRYGNKLDQNRIYLEKIVDSIDFKLRRHTIVVEGFINDKKVTFGVDSAAEFNQINKDLDKDALKSFYPKKRLTLMGAGNGMIEVMAGKLYRVKLSKTIYFGPMNTVLTNLHKMNQAFGTNLDGVLGYEFFAQKRTIINYQKEKLYFIDYPILRQ